jgi:hypothetical protein
VLLMILAVLSASSTLAAPHSPYKDYHSGHSHKRQNLASVPAPLARCLLSPTGTPGPGDHDFISRGIRYSQLCLSQLGLDLIGPLEASLCRTECGSCDTFLGYEISCLVALAIQELPGLIRLQELQDIQERVNTNLESFTFALTLVLAGRSNGSDKTEGLPRPSATRPHRWKSGPCHSFWSRCLLQQLSYQPLSRKAL